MPEEKIAEHTALQQAILQNNGAPIAESLIKRIPQPHIQCAPVYSALLAIMEDQVVMKRVFRS